MLPIQDDHYQRAQKARKQNIYRQILDEQIRYKKEYHTSAQQPIPSQYPNLPLHQRQRRPNNQLKHRQSISPVKDDNFDRRYRYQTEPKEFEDRTEKHIKHCEQILKNLRQLKEKRNQRESRLAQRQAYSQQKKTEEHYRQNRLNPKDWNYYPKNQYFSVVPNPNNSNSNSTKFFANKKQIKPKLKSYNTIDNQQETARNRENPEYMHKSVRISSKKIKNKDQNSKSRAVPGAISDRNKSYDSGHPTGPSKKYSATQRSPMQTKKPAKRLQEEQLRQSNERELQQLKSQLSECLVELAKFIKIKKEQDQQEEARKSQLVHEQVQVGMSGVEIQELDKQKNKEAKIHQLKLKALIKLRKIRDQSRDLAIKVGGEASEKQLKRKHPYSNSKSRLSRQLEVQIAKQNQIEKENEPNLPLDSSVKSPRSVTPLLYPERVPPQEQKHKQNEQLVRSIASHLNRQQQQNEQLAYCLKELSEYLKNQNQQMQLLAKSRQVSPSQTKNQKQKIIDRKQSRSNLKPSPIKTQKQVRYQQFPKSPEKKNNQTQHKPKEEVKQPTKEEENKLKEAFLHRLKKARMRGSFLTEKIEAHKKSNSKSTPIQDSTDQNPIPIQEKQVQIIPSTEQPNP